MVPGPHYAKVFWHNGIVFCCAVWGPHLTWRVVLFQCDNMSEVVQSGRAPQDPLAMSLLRALWFFVAHYDISLTIEHLAGVCNTTADELSQNNMQQFFFTNPLAEPLQTPLPPELLQVTAVQGPDWPSPEFRRLFGAIIRRI